MAGRLSLSVMGHRVYRPDGTSMLRPARVRLVTRVESEMTKEFPRSAP